MTLALQHVSKSFGSKTVYDNLNLEIPAGTLHGIIGPNGTGKTTFFRLVLGLLPPDSGQITWRGAALSGKTLRLAYVPEERGLYPHMSVRQQLRWFGRLAGLNPRESLKRADLWIETLALEPYADTAASDLSKGNARKVQLAVGLLGDPELLILDEPFDGMDPVNIRLIQSVLNRLHDHGVTILASSHSLDFLDQFCESFTMLYQGTAALHGPLAALREALPWRRLTVRFQTPDAEARLASWVQHHPDITLEAGRDPHRATYRVPVALADRLPLRDIWELGSVMTLSLDAPTLTDVYWNVFGTDSTKTREVS